MNLKRMRDLASFFYQQRIKGFDAPTRPWLDPQSLAWFEDKLGKAQSYLEFGSGGSTRWAAELGIETVSIECDRFFARSVQKSLPDPHKVKLIEVDIGLTGPWGVPLPGSPSPKRLVKWRRYIEAPFSKLDQLPELILVDGRFRRACALRCAIASRETGATADLLFDDYYMEGRETYHKLEQQLGVPVQIGEAAHFALRPDNHVTEKDVSLALQDYR